MPNTFTTVSRRGFGSRIISSIIGVPIGIVLIFGSCFLLYWNEGRTDYSKIASKSVSVQASQVDQSQNGKFISVTGSVTGQRISDGAYLNPMSAVAVERTVEEYAWVETQQTQSNNSTGGGQTNKTTYTYSEQWVDQPANSNNFQVPAGHQNPAKPLNDSLVKAASGKVGAYTFDPQTIKLPSLQDVALSSSNTTLLNSTIFATAAPITQSTGPTFTSSVPITNNPSPILSNLRLASSEYIYGGSGNLSAPQLGDIRISYQDLPAGTNVTVFGQLNNGSIGAYTDSNNHTLYDLLAGDRQTAIATLHNQYEKTTWIFRGIGVGLIWIGLIMLFGPLDMLLDFIPVAGEIGGMLTFIITLPIALLIGGTVIIIGYTLHHVIALLIGVPLIFAIWIGIFKLIKKARNIPSRLSGNNLPAVIPQQPTSQLNPASPAAGSLFPSNNASTSAEAINPVPPKPITPPQSIQHSPGVIVQPSNPENTIRPQAIKPTTLLSDMSDSDNPSPKQE
jgi:hypothetical protein